MYKTLTKTATLALNYLNDSSLLGFTVKYACNPSSSRRFPLEDISYCLNINVSENQINLQKGFHGEGVHLTPLNCVERRCSCGKSAFWPLLALLAADSRNSWKRKRNLNWAIWVQIKDVYPYWTEIITANLIWPKTTFTESVKSKFTQKSKYRKLKEITFMSQ